MTDDELLEKLRGFGLDLDRDSIERLSSAALAAEEVARPLIEERGIGDDVESDWIWICLVTLWKRWWPDKVCLEFLDDKIQAGYEQDRLNQEAAGAAVWLDAWSDVLFLCDATGIRSIEEFDDRFPMTQSLYNWSQDFEMDLWNAGLRDREYLLARIDVCEEALRRFPHEDQLMTENRRRALAESYFEAGMTAKADDLFESWLAADPCWGWGWIGWADCYTPYAGRSGDYGRAEKLLRRGFSIPAVRDRASIAERLQHLCEDTGRSPEARQYQQQAEQLRGKGEPTARHRLDRVDPDDQDGGSATVRHTVTMNFSGQGLPLDQFPDLMQALRARPPDRPAPATRPAAMRRVPAGVGRSSRSAAVLPSPARE
jgi:tetratricopeptide (TPR) repeat protein